ncbi:MAG: peptidylprolyl isomerase [Clostridiales bacterium]|nr:peptidylprolyl isomerase [Clostridiales bacterium]
MKKIRISAVLTAICIMAGMALSGCKETKTTMGTSATGATGSDTGLSFSVEDTSGSGSDASVPGVSSSYVKMTFENNYDRAAIEQMSKIVKIRDMQFTALDYNFYFANEYVQLMKMQLQGVTNIPMTQSGFLDMEGQLTSDMKVKDYLRKAIVSDFQGEVFLLEYAQKNNVKLDSDVPGKIQEEFDKTKKSAEDIGMTLDEYLKSYYGPSATEDGLREILQRYEMVNAAMNHYVKEYKFAEGESMLPTVYHVLYPTLDLNTGEKLPDDKKAEAKQKAEALKASATSLDDLKTKAEQGKVANEVAEAAEYTVSVGQMVKPFEEWCFADHNIGDMDVVETEYGYHVMYFVGKKEADTEQKRQIALKAMNNEMEKAIESDDYLPVYS